MPTTINGERGIRDLTEIGNNLRVLDATIAVIKQRIQDEQLGIPSEPDRHEELHDAFSKIADGVDVSDIAEKFRVVADTIGAVADKANEEMFKRVYGRLDELAGFTFGGLIEILDCEKSKYTPSDCITEIRSRLGITESS